MGIHTLGSLEKNLTKHDDSMQKSLWGSSLWEIQQHSSIYISAARYE